MKGVDSSSPIFDLKNGSMQVERYQNAYPMCRTTGITKPKRSFKSFFKTKRKEYRENERLRRQMMTKVLVAVENGELTTPDQNGFIGGVRNLLRTSKCSGCGKDTVTSFMRVCQCCGAMVCSECTCKETYTNKTRSVDFYFCRYCGDIFSVVTVGYRMSVAIKEAEENPVLLLRTFIINTCISFMEEYYTFHIFMKNLIKSGVPTENDLRHCEDGLKVVKAKTQKVFGLDAYIDECKTPDRKSDAIVLSNIIRSVNQFKRTTLFHSINEVKDYESLLTEIEGAMACDPEVIAISNAMVPFSGGVIKITLNTLKDVKVTIAGIEVPFTTQDHSVIITVPPASNDPIIDLKLSIKGKNVQLPMDFLYFDAPEDYHEDIDDRQDGVVSDKVKELDEKRDETIAKIITKHKIEFIECDDISDESDYESSSECSDDETDVPKDVSGNLQVANQEEREQSRDDTRKSCHVMTLSNGELDSVKSTQQTLTGVDSKSEGPAILRCHCPQQHEDNSVLEENLNARLGQSNSEGRIIVKRGEDTTAHTHNPETLTPAPNIKMDGMFDQAIAGLTSAIELDNILPVRYFVHQIGKFTINGRGFGKEPLVYFGNQLVEVYEEITDNTIIGYTPYFRKSEVLSIRIENEYGSKLIKENAVFIDNSFTESV